MIYEGYAPHGVAVLVEAATDNVTRTAGSIRSLFAHNGGNLGSTGSVNFMFKRIWACFVLIPKASIRMIWNSI